MARLHPSERFRRRSPVRHLRAHSPRTPVGWCRSSARIAPVAWSQQRPTPESVTTATTSARLGLDHERVLRQCDGADRSPRRRCRAPPSAAGTARPWRRTGPGASTAPGSSRNRQRSTERAVRRARPTRVGAPTADRPRRVVDVGAHERRAGTPWRQQRAGRVAQQLLLVGEARSPSLSSPRGKPSTRSAMMLRWISRRAAGDRVGEAHEEARAPSGPLVAALASTTAPYGALDLHAQLVQRLAELATLASFRYECSGADCPARSDVKPL